MAGARDKPHREQADRDGFDSASLALFAYFVGLIVVVAALLVLPALY